MNHGKIFTLTEGGGYHREDGGQRQGGGGGGHRERAQQGRHLRAPGGKHEFHTHVSQ